MRLFICICLLISNSVFAMGRDDAPDVTVIPRLSSSPSVSAMREIAHYSIGDDEDADISSLPGFEAVHDISDAVVACVNRSVKQIFKELTPDQRRYIATCAIKGNFDAGARSVNVWKIISHVCDPLQNLAKVAVIVLPSVSSIYARQIFSSFNEESSSVLSDINIAVAVAGVVALTFDKICGYANDKIASQEKIALCLKAMESSAPAEEENVGLVIN